MSGSELSEHAGYLADHRKLAAYETGLRAALASREGVVLDLGAGSGILGLLAARAGARRVYAVESGSIIGAAASVAAQSEFAASITHIQGGSTEVDLPEPVDVAVCDQIGGFVHDAGVLEYFADARRRLLAPDGVFVPARFDLFLAPVECDEVRRQLNLWDSAPAGFDFSPFAELATNTEHRVEGDDVRTLGTAVHVGTVDADHVEPIKGQGTTAITSSGRCDGLVGWFTAHLGGGATLTNDPDAPDRMRRWCNFYPLRTAVDVTTGDIVALDVDIRPLLHAVTWKIEVSDPEGRAKNTPERHSTLLGRFLSRDDLDRSRGLRVAATALAAVVGRAIDLADGSLSTDDIMERLTAEFPTRVASPSSERTVRNLLERLSDVATAPVETAR